MNSGSNICDLPYCNVPKLTNNDRCILHIKSFNKDVTKFYNALSIYSKEKANKYVNIFFPDERFSIFEDIEEDIQFNSCHFPKAFIINGKTIFKKFILERCKFYGPVSINNCTFNHKVFIRGCEFNNGVYFIKSKFFNDTYFAFNNFKTGINLHNATFKKEMDFKFRHCNLDFSFFYETDIFNMVFIHCDWGKSKIIADEQYDLRVHVKFGIMGIPNTYINQAILYIYKYFKKHDFLIRYLFPIEYKRQEELIKNGFIVYVWHTGWNDCKMAADTYRNIRLKYTDQGEPEIAGDFFFREKVNQRRSKKHWKRIFDFFFKELLFGYGERPGRVASISILFVLLYSTILFSDI